MLAFIFPKGILTNKSYEGFLNFKFGNKQMNLSCIIDSKKPYFGGEEPIILILKHQTDSVKEHV